MYNYFSNAAAKVIAKFCITSIQMLMIKAHSYRVTNTLDSQKVYHI